MDNNDYRHLPITNKLIMQSKIREEESFRTELERVLHDVKKVAEHRAIHDANALDNLEREVKELRGALDDSQNRVAQLEAVIAEQNEEAPEVKLPKVGTVAAQRRKQREDAKSQVAETLDWWANRGAAEGLAWNTRERVLDNGSIMPQIELKAYKDHEGKSPWFDNPHNWSGEDMQSWYQQARESYSMAPNIRLMGLAGAMKKGPYKA